MNYRNCLLSIGLLHLLWQAATAVESQPLVEKDRPDWEIKFSDAGNEVLSVMPGESKKTFHDPLTGKDVAWEQDIYSPAFTAAKGELYCVYRAFGDDGEWRLGLASSDDGVHFTRSDKPVLYPKPGDAFLDVAGRLKEQGRLISAIPTSSPTATATSTCISISFISATRRTISNWPWPRRATCGNGTCADGFLPPRRRATGPSFPSGRRGGCRSQQSSPGSRATALWPAKIRGKYWMYFNCYATKGSYCLCVATSDDLIDWKSVQRLRKAKLGQSAAGAAGLFR